MELWTFSAALFLWAHFLSSASKPTVETATAAITAKWNTDLRVAVESTALGTEVGRGHAPQRSKTSVWFLNNSSIVATFVTRRGKPHLSVRDNSDESLPLRLSTVILDAGTGKITKTETWPTEFRFAGIVAVHDGKFVTQRGTALSLCSSDAKELKRLNLPPLQGDRWGWYATASPTGKSILLATADSTTTSQTPWLWVDTDSLQVVHSWKETQNGRVAVSDTTIARIACGTRSHHCDPHVEIRNLAADWKTIAPIEAQFQLSPQFVNEDMLFISDHPWKLLRTDGTVLFVENSPSEGSMVVPSAGGQRFIVPFFKLAGDFPALDIAGRGVLKKISIYDAPFQTRAYNLEVKGPKITRPPAVDFALSPDGSLLAVLHGESVYLFQLPPALSVPSPPKSDQMEHH
jgi:hypothetical protein